MHNSGDNDGRMPSRKRSTAGKLSIYNRRLRALRAQLLDLPAGDKGALAIGIPESAYYVWFASVRKKRELYLDLCRKYDDFDYKEIMDMPSTIYIDSRPERIFSGISFRSVDLVCDKDFDEQHPAGTSLADISQLHSKSAMPLFAAGKKSSCNPKYGTLS